MPSQRNKISKQAEAQSSTHNSKRSPTPTTTGKIKNDVIFAKDKSPDDMEILD